MSTPIPPHPLALLRPRRERPCDSGAAKDRNEGDQLSPQYLALNPNKKMPTLATRGKSASRQAKGAKADDEHAG